MKTVGHPPQFHAGHLLFVFLIILCLVLVGITGLVFRSGQINWQQLTTKNTNLFQQKDDLASQLASISGQLANAQTELAQLKSANQFQINQNLMGEIKNVQTTYQQTLSSYEQLTNLQASGGKTAPLNTLFAQVLSQLSQQNYSSASATLALLNQKISAMSVQVSTANLGGGISANVTTSNTPPSSGYARQTVQSDVGAFVVDLLTADLNTARVQIETASPRDCGNNCPVDSLANFVARSGGFAGINGPYFCPTEYPSCVGKTGSFDTLLMNKNKVYFNSANNVYSIVPAMIFSGNSVRLVGKSEEWGRDTSPDAVLAAQPLLISGGNIAFGGNNDGKENATTNRSFIANTGSQLYIGVIHGVTVLQAAHVLKTLGVQSALNLDDGGSTAFMVNGKYIDGPGRNTPFGIVLVRK